MTATLTNDLTRAKRFLDKDEAYARMFEITETQGHDAVLIKVLGEASHVIRVYDGETGRIFLGWDAE